MAMLEMYWLKSVGAPTLKLIQYGYQPSLGNTDRLD